MTDHYAVANPEDLPQRPAPFLAGPPYPCELCDRTFETQSALGVHFRSHGSNKEPCPECGLEFFPGPGMSRHRQANHGLAKLDGTPAKSVNNTAAITASKAKSKVSKAAKKICPECHKPIRAQDMARHLRTVHKDKYPQTKAAPVAHHDDDFTVDDVFGAVVGMMFPRGVIPLTAVPALIQWREATQHLLREVAGV